MAPDSGNKDRLQIPFAEIDQRCINTVRVLSADMVQHANSGHPGAPMGCAPLMHVLFTRHMRLNPHNSRWFNRDRFVLSNGHACPLQYSTLHLLGYGLQMKDLQAFRSVNSLTPGHPEANHTPGIEVSSGPLGQGFASAVGMAMAEAHLSSTFNREGLNVVENSIFVLMGDGCMMEGISSEAASLAGHLKLGKLIAFYDQNHVSIDGDTDLAFTEDVGKRFEAYGWKVEYIYDGDHDLEGISDAIVRAKQTVDAPSLIIVRTTIGFGSKNAGTEKVHGSPLGDEDLAEVKKKWGFDPQSFFVIPEEVQTFYSRITNQGQQWESEWELVMSRYEDAYPELAKDLRRRIKGELPAHWKSSLPIYSQQDPAKATRQLSGEILNKLAVEIPELVGGSADLTTSTLTQLKCSHDFQHGAYTGRYFRYGVREHAMFAMSNGMASYGGVIPFASTFLNFLTYGWGAVRLSALSKFRVIYIMTHDSIGLGEDGPTHQPIEVAALCRATPRLLFIRPADGNEVVGAYQVAIEHAHQPSVLSLTRQSVPHLEGSSAEKVAQGAYVLKDYLVDEQRGKVFDQVTTSRLLLVATGSEVPICVEAAQILSHDHHISVRVVSMPCWALFEQQPLTYRISVFPDGVPSLAVEVYNGLGWSRYSHAQHSLNQFGNSGQYKDVYANYGFTTSIVVTKACDLVGYYAEGRTPCSLIHRPFEEK